MRDDQRGEFKPIETEVEERYNDKMNVLNDEFYEQSDYLNFGYWRQGTSGQKEACDNLMNELLSLIPKKTGTILDAACGKGATTRYLLKYYKPAKITGINISERQLERCRQNAPGCKFLNMNATKLDFSDAGFDSVICVEAAFHFNTRRKFFEEAHRVLKPSGTLVLSDILLTNIMYKLRKTIPAENYIPDIESYRSLLEQIGFTKVVIRDETHACWGGMFINSQRFLREKVQQRALNFFIYRKIMKELMLDHNNILNYILVSAVKKK